LINKSACKKDFPYVDPEKYLDLLSDLEDISKYTMKVNFISVGCGNRYTILIDSTLIRLK